MLPRSVRSASAKLLHRRLAVNWDACLAANGVRRELLDPGADRKARMGGKGRLDFASMACISSRRAPSRRTASNVSLATPILA
jgi:hypothetical protein